MTTSPLSTVCKAIRRVIQLFAAYKTLRPLVRDAHPEASPAPVTDYMSEHTPGPATAPSPAPEPRAAAAPDYIPEPAADLGAPAVDALDELVVEAMHAAATTPPADIAPDNVVSALYAIRPKVDPICQPPVDGSYQWMCSHEWQVAGAGLRCVRCDERWPNYRLIREARA